MNQKLKDKISLFYKRLDKEKGSNISISKCNGFIEDFKDLKEKMYDSGYDWIEDFNEIEELSSDFFDGDPTDEDVEDAMEEIHEQLSRIMYKLGINLEAQIGSMASASSNVNSPINIHVNPTFQQSQQQSQSVEVNIEINLLVKEFEKEISKPYPDKSKIKNIAEKVLEQGKQFAPQILNLIIKNWNKLFGGLF